VVNAQPNVHVIPDYLTTIPVDESKLKKIIIGESSKDHFILNEISDTVKTGIPVEIKGKMVPCIYPKSIPAMDLRMNHNAINDMRYLDIDQGLRSSDIVCMIEDQAGNLWFGTGSSGGYRYDGKSFVNFTEKEGLSNNAVFSILEDKCGNIWFGTFGGGLTKYDGKNFVHFTEKEGFSNNNINSILEDESGNIWFATDGSGVSKYDGISFVHFTENEGLSDNYIYCMLEDIDGNLWFASGGGGVSKYDGESFVHFTENEGLANNIVYSIMEDKSGNIWFGTFGGGACRYDGKSFVNFAADNGLSNDYVYSILEDSFGNIWFALDRDGVNKYDGKCIVHYDEDQGLSNNWVLSVMEDKSRNIWFATWGGGINRYKENSFVHYSEDNGLSNNNICSIVEDKSGNIWFGTYGGGLCKYNGKSFTYINGDYGQFNSSAVSILEDKSGNLWFASSGSGVTKYDGKSLVNFTENEGLCQNDVNSIVEDRQGNLWFGTRNGVSKFDGKSFINYTEEDGLSSNHIRCIIEDKSGNLWFGTWGGGVSMYNGLSFVHYTEREGLSSNTIWSILEDQSGNMWFGTRGGGVSRFNGEFFTHFTEAEGLSNNVVCSIVQDHLGDIWVTTEMGINRIKTSKPDKQNVDTLENFSILTLNRLDGLKAASFNVNSALIDSKNHIWFGSREGVEMLDLNIFQSSDKVPSTFLRCIDIQEQFIDFHNLSDSSKEVILLDSVARFANYPINLVLPYNLNQITFHFSAIDWAAPHKLKYQTKLVGLDKNWSPVTEKTEADYRNIPYGTFTFKVRAIGESQIWGDPFEYTFTILPPWWHTWWFRGLMAFAFVSILFLLYRSRTAALRARQKQLEKTVEKRTEELVQKNIIVEKQKEIVEQQKEQVEEAHKEITDSINYAERIQRSLMASKKLLDENLSDYFNYLNPKEKVSGDFYWASKLANENFCLVAADSTGHGVPGAIMSMLNIASLEKAVVQNISESSELLNFTRKKIIETLANDGSKDGGKDGMDTALLVFNKDKTHLEFSLANNPLWIIRNNELIEYKPDKLPVGRHDNQHIPFTKNSIDLQKGDMIYIFTDGFADQFGGEKGKKFKYSALKELFFSIHSKPTDEQKAILDITFENWRGSLEQVDDVCVVGVRV